MISKIATESFNNSSSFRSSLVQIPSHFIRFSARSQGSRFPYTVSGENDGQCPIVSYSSLLFGDLLLNKVSAEKSNRSMGCAGLGIDVLSSVHLRNDRSSLHE